MTNEFAYSRMSFTAAFKRNVTQVSVYLAKFRKDVFVRTKHPPICIVSLNYALKATLLRRKGALILVFPRVRRFGGRGQLMLSHSFRDILFAREELLPSRMDVAQKKVNMR